MPDRIRKLAESRSLRVAAGFMLGYYAATLLLGVIVDLFDDVDEARIAGHVEGYAQARRELADELGLALDEPAPIGDEDQDVDEHAPSDGTEPALPLD